MTLFCADGIIDEQKFTILFRKIKGLAIMEFWKIGENKAVEYLDKKGYRIIRRNYRCRQGEIDIIAIDDNALCFIEVKTRSSLRHGLPCEAVSYGKLTHIRHVAGVYMSRYRHDVCDVRIEVVEVLYRKGHFYVRHIKNIT